MFTQPVRHGCKCLSCSPARCRLRTGVPHSSAATCLAQSSTAHGNACSRARWVRCVLCSGVRYACVAPQLKAGACFLQSMLIQCMLFLCYSAGRLVEPASPAFLTGQASKQEWQMPTRPGKAAPPDAMHMEIKALASMVTHWQRKGVTPAYTLLAWPPAPRHGPAPARATQPPPGVATR